MVNARLLTYVEEGSDDPHPITSNNFFNNRRSNCVPPQPPVILMSLDATNACLIENDRLRREYVSDICKGFITNYLLQIDKFHCKGGPVCKIRLEEVVIIHTKRLM